MPEDSDYDFGNRAVANGLLQQDQLEECVEVLVALERVGSMQRIWDVVGRKGYMSASDIADLQDTLNGQQPDVAVPDEGSAVFAVDWDVPLDTEVEQINAPLAMIGVEPLVEEEAVVARRVYQPGDLVLMGVKDPIQGRRFPLNKRQSIIGRDQLVDVVVEAPSVSRRHAEIVYGEQQVILKDLGSRNHVLVNGARVSEAVVNPGDTIHIGRVLFFVTEA
jgi:FHA domain